MSRIILSAALGLGLSASLTAFALAQAASDGTPPARAGDGKPVIVTDPAKIPGGHYLVSVPHTQVVFSAMHAFISPYYGRIDHASGTLDYDAKDPEKSKVAVEMKLSDFSTPFVNATGKHVLDETLCKPEGLDCAQFPTMSFQSTGIKKTGANTGDITGNFTMKGVTKPVVLHATFHGSEPSPSRNVIGFSATGQLKRTDFGVDKAYWNVSVSDEVNFMIEAEFTQPVAQ